MTDEDDPFDPFTGIKSVIAIGLPFWLVIAAMALALSGCAHCAWFCNPFVR